MTSEQVKTRLHVVVTPTIRFILDYDSIKFIFTGKKYTETEFRSEYDGWENFLSFELITDFIDDIEYNDYHIYLHKSGADTYIDLDFNLAHFMWDDTKKIFDKILKNRRDEYDRPYESPSSMTWNISISATNWYYVGNSVKLCSNLQ